MQPLLHPAQDFDTVHSILGIGLMLALLFPDSSANVSQCMLVA